MRTAIVMSSVLALAALSGCDRAPAPAPEATGSAATPAATIPAAAPSAPAQAAAAPEPTETEPLPDADLPPRLRAIGTEPFWAADLVGDQLTYSTPDDQEGTSFKVRREATPQGSVLIGRLDDENFVLAIARRECSDGMSDRRYRWRAVLRRDGKSLDGCAETPDRLNAAPRP